jgi:hypothetical protein
LRPLILEFAETPEVRNFDFSLIEYSTKQNLSVMKGTETAAISYASMDTETFSKGNQDPTDSDNNLRRQLKFLLDTSTETRQFREPSDSDVNFHPLKLLMDTQTLTETVEPTDADK